MYYEVLMRIIIKYDFRIIVILLYLFVFDLLLELEIDCFKIIIL